MRAKSEKIVGDAVHVFLGSGERGSPVVLPRKVGGQDGLSAGAECFFALGVRKSSNSHKRASLGQDSR